MRNNCNVVNIYGNTMRVRLDIFEMEDGVWYLEVWEAKYILKETGMDLSNCHDWDELKTIMKQYISEATSHDDFIDRRYVTSRYFDDQELELYW